MLLKGDTCTSQLYLCQTAIGQNHKRLNCDGCINEFDPDTCH